jgi:hypothetical protein
MHVFWCRVREPGLSQCSLQGDTQECRPFIVVEASSGRCVFEGVGSHSNIHTALTVMYRTGPFFPSDQGLEPISMREKISQANLGHCRRHRILLPSHWRVATGALVGRYKNGPNGHPNLTHLPKPTRRCVPVKLPHLVKAVPTTAT